MKGFFKGFGGGLLAVAAIGGCELVVGSRDVTVDPNWGTGGATSGPSSSSGTGATSCVPKSTMACYTGAPGTETNGTCKGGTWTCKDDGSGYGDCVGEVVPVTEDCSKKVDTDCNGFVCSASQWVDQFANVQTNAVASDPATGAIYLTGHFKTTATFDSNVFNTAGGLDAFLVKLDATGAVAWAKQIGGAKDEDGLSVAFFNHAVTVVGTTTGNLSLNGKQIPFGLLVARYGEDGTSQWTTACAGGDGASVAIDPTNGDAILAGSFVNIQCGSQMLSSHNGVDPDAFVTRLSAAQGTEVFTTDEAHPVGASATATDGQGSVYFAGNAYSGSVVVGPTTLPKGLFAAKVASNGAYLWAKAFGQSNDLPKLAADSNGDLFVWAECSDPSNDFGCGPLAQLDVNGNDVCVAKLKAADGSCVWAQRFGVTGSSSSVFGLAIDSNGDVAIAGTTFGAMPIQTQVVTTGSFLAHLRGAKGDLHWLDQFTNAAGNLAYSKQDTLVFAGTFTGTADVGKGMISTPSMQLDTFVALIEP